MSSASSPQHGFNDNVEHRGRVFHVQTEDSGARHPHVITHLFADGGRILKTVRTSYAEHVGAEQLIDVVRDLMKRQHRAMLLALRGGRLDDAIDAPPPTLGPASLARPAADGAPPSLATFRRQSAPEPSVGSLGEGPLDLHTLERAALGVVADSAPTFDEDVAAPSRCSAARPAPIFQPGARGGPLPEPEIDARVLAFLAGSGGGGGGGA